MSLNTIDYGWIIGVLEYEPVPILDPMAPDELRKFTSCNCHGYCRNQQCSGNKHGAMCVSPCGVCKGITCIHFNHDGVESGEGIDSDF